MCAMACLVQKHHQVAIPIQEWLMMSTGSPFEVFLPEEDDSVGGAVGPVPGRWVVLLLNSLQTRYIHMYVSALAP